MKTTTTNPRKVPKAERPSNWTGKSINWSLRIPFSDYELIRKAADASDRSMANFIVLASRAMANDVLAKEG